MKILAVACVVLLWAAFRLPAQTVPAIALHESAPVTINGLRFVARTQAQWEIGPGKSCAIAVQLQVTNETRGVLDFPTFDTFSLRLLTAAGKSVDGLQERFGTIYTGPLRLAPGATTVLTREADLGAVGSRTDYFTYADGTGSILHVMNLDFGSYSLSFDVESPAGKARKDANFFHASLPDGEPLWSGAGWTKEATFQIVRQP